MHALQAVMVTAGVSMASAANTCKTVHIGTFQSIVCPPDPNGPHRTKCLLALPGRSNEANFANIFNGMAAEGGYAAFSLQYASSPDTFKTCSTDYSDLDCGEKTRLAKQIGGEFKSVHVTEEQSVEYRTREVLLYLTNQTEGKPSPLEKPELFSHCLTGDQVKWSVFTVMGGSEGSGQAAFVGYHQSVDKVIQFSGIDDGVVRDLNAGDYDPPKWTTTVGKTPYSKYYGFGEVYDQACRAWRMNWAERAFNMPGGWVNVNLLKSGTPLTPYHRICSDRTKSTAGHIATVWDKATPKLSDGTYVYAPVWLHLLGLTLMSQSNESKAFSLSTTPTPITAKSAVDVADCDDYPNIKQLWMWDAALGTLRLTESSGLVLDCGKCTTSDRQMQVTNLATDPSPSQKWNYERNHFVHVESGLCLAHNPELEPGLVFLANCSAASVGDISWTLSRHTTLFHQRCAFRFVTRTRPNVNATFDASLEE